MTHAELVKAVEVLYRRRMETVGAETLGAMEQIARRANAGMRSRKSSVSSVAKRPRRDSAELERLSEALLVALAKEPGAPMARLAAQLDSSARQLQRPMALLKKARRAHGGTEAAHALLPDGQRRGVGSRGQQRGLLAPHRVGEELEHVDVLLAGGVHDGHHALGETIAAFTLSAERALPPKNKSSEFTLGVIVRRLDIRDVDESPQSHCVREDVFCGAARAAKAKPKR